MMNLVKDNDRFARLLEALESGWEIEEPVLVGENATCRKCSWNKLFLTSPLAESVLHLNKFLSWSRRSFASPTLSAIPRHEKDATATPKMAER